ncbi:outer membrane protein assembly factor BamB family protein [Yinghuangia soli]|uniref:PQQ-binding-like beta-propeller repeat protein n=1 Tax=Yinghuangia soli TaxID=2908204 RepID=A0AA41U6A3_9ACTN|nr:PQQ-binding-like beta-propeller repeat protein [Yinghuangia soli]MCF2532742.1 PQQ-binding-like beta-propeller repeat protein [Yinghuangia soli]
MRELEPGDPRRLGDHELVGVLGTGGLGRVYAARAPHGKRLAVKLTHPQVVRAAPDFADRFGAVMGDLARVRNLGAGRIVQWDVEGGRPWYSRRYVPGAALTEILALCRSVPGAAAAIVGGVARGLAAMHDAELAHGAVVPGNVLLSASSAQLVDGGLVRMLGPGPPLSGTAFAAPEGGTSMAADLYGLGVLFGLCTFGWPPPGADEAPGVPADHIALVRALLSRDPAARPPAAEVAAQLRGSGRNLEHLLPSAARQAIARYTRLPAQASVPSVRHDVFGADGYAGLLASMAAIGGAEAGGDAAGGPRTPGAESGAAAQETVPGARVPESAREPAAVGSAGVSGAANGTPRRVATTAAAAGTAAKADAGSWPDAGTMARNLWSARLPGVQNLYAVDGYLYADGDTFAVLDAATGETLWSRPGWRMVAPPREDRVYLAQGTRIVRVNARTGAESWRTDIAVARGLWARSAGRLARAERAFRVHAVHEPVPGVLTAIGGHTELFGLDPETGELLWNRREPRRSAFTCDGAGAIHLSGDGREPARALAAESGELLWQDDADDSIVMAVDQGWVLCGRFVRGTAEVGEYVVRAAASGDLVLRDRTPGEVALLGGGVLYVLGNGRLRALRPCGGKELWDVSWADAGAGMYLAPAGSEAYLRGEDRRVRAVDLEDGSVRWASGPIPAREPMDAVGGQLDRALPVLAEDDVVCVRSHSDSVLIVLDRSDGSERWWWRASHGTLTMVAPVVAGRCVYVVDGDVVRALTGRNYEG